MLLIKAVHHFSNKADHFFKSLGFERNISRNDSWRRLSSSISCHRSVVSLSAENLLSASMSADLLIGITFGEKVIIAVTVVVAVFDTMYIHRQANILGVATSPFS